MLGSGYIEADNQSPAEVCASAVGEKNWPMVLTKCMKLLADAKMMFAR